MSQDNKTCVITSVVIVALIISILIYIGVWGYEDIFIKK
jgi:hypothetical protein